MLRFSSTEHDYSPITPASIGGGGPNGTLVANASPEREKHARNQNKQVRGGPSRPHFGTNPCRPIPHRRASASGPILISDAPGPLKNRVTSARFSHLLAVVVVINARFITTDNFYAVDYLPHPGRRLDGACSRQLDPFFSTHLLECSPSRRRFPFGPRCAARRGPGVARQGIQLVGRPGTSLRAVYLLPLCGSVDAAHSPRLGTGRPAFVRHSLHASWLQGASPSASHRCINKLWRRIMS